MWGVVRGQSRVLVGLAGTGRVSVFTAVWGTPATLYTSSHFPDRGMLGVQISVSLYPAYLCVLWIPTQIISHCFTQ